MKSLIRRLGSILTGSLMPKIAYPVVRGPLRGARLVLGSPGGEGGGASLFVNLFERRQTASFARVIQPGDVFFDIGANIGFYTLLGSRLVGPKGSVVSFEPVVRNLSYLYRHVTLNRCRNVSVLAAACSDRATLATFSIAQNVGEGHLDTVADVPGRSMTAGKALVPTVTVDSVAEKLGVLPDVMKIDVEGAELEVLRGAETVLRARRPQIFLSIHSDELRRVCLQYLAGFGYEASPMDPGEAKPTEYLMRAEV